MTTQHINFLNTLRESGVTNMFGAGVYLMEELSLDKREARSVLKEWIASFKI